MAKYKLSTGLWTTGSYDFNSDKEAWEELRIKLPNKYATLYKILMLKYLLITKRSMCQHTMPNTVLGLLDTVVIMLYF